MIRSPDGCLLRNQTNVVVSALRVGSVVCLGCGHLQACGCGDSRLGFGKGRRTFFADVASTKVAIDNDSAKVEITCTEFSMSEGEQVDVGAAVPGAFSFLLCENIVSHGRKDVVDDLTAVVHVVQPLKTFDS